MFGDVQIGIWGSTMTNRRRMYFEAALRPGVYDVIVNFDTSIRMTAGEVGGYDTGDRLGKQERKNAATDGYEAYVLVTSAPPLLAIVVSLDAPPPIGEYVFQRRDDTRCH